MEPETEDALLRELARLYNRRGEYTEDIREAKAGVRVVDRKIREKEAELRKRHGDIPRGRPRRADDLDSFRSRVAALVATDRTHAWSIDEVSQAMGVDRGRARVTLAHLAAEGRIDRVGRGKYKAEHISKAIERTVEKASERRARLLGAIEDEPHKPMTANRAVISGISPTAAQATVDLLFLYEEGSILRAKRGVYVSRDSVDVMPRSVVGKLRSMGLGGAMEGQDDGQGR